MNEYVVIVIVIVVIVVLIVGGSDKHKKQLHSLIDSWQMLEALLRARDAC